MVRHAVTHEKFRGYRADNKPWRRYTTWVIGNDPEFLLRAAPEDLKCMKASLRCTQALSALLRLGGWASCVRNFHLIKFMWPDCSDSMFSQIVLGVISSPECKQLPSEVSMKDETRFLQTVSEPTVSAWIQYKTFCLRRE